MSLFNLNKINTNKNIHIMYESIYIMDIININNIHDKIELWKNKLNRLKIFINKNNRLPFFLQINNVENKLYYWFKYQEINYENKLFLMKEEIIYNLWLDFINDDKYKIYFDSI